jgi:hypothetical protein
VIDTQKPLFIDPATEEQLLAGVLQQKTEILSSGLVLQLADWQFSVPAYQWLVREVIAKGELPSKPILNEKIQNGLINPDEREKFAESLLRLYDLQLTFTDAAIKTYREYLSFQRMSAATRKFFEGFSKTKQIGFGLRDMHAGIQEATRLLEGPQVRVFDYAKTWNDREARRKHERDNPDQTPRLRLGVSKFDQQVKMKLGTVTQFLAPMKRYKSIILASAAYSGVLQGFNVGLAVAENTPELTMDRLDSMFTQINYERIVSYLKTPKEKEYADKLFERINNWPQRLKIIKCEPREMGVVDLEREFDALEREEGFVAEVKIYDYLNLMRPSIGNIDDHLGQTQIVWDMQQVAKRPNKGAIVVTAAQTNMEGAGLDKDGKPTKVSAHHQGRALGIAQGVDASIGINIDPPPQADGGAVAPPQIILSLLYLRDGKIKEPDIRLVSEVDRMCMEREMRFLWDEASEWDGVERLDPPGNV